MSYQRYLVDYMRTGLPSWLWPKGVFGSEISNTLHVATNFNLIKDRMNNAESCDIFDDALAAATASEGMRILLPRRY
jgi:hypothetical protein